MSSHLIGSPLDQLPYPPSALPMAPRFSNDHVRKIFQLTDSKQTFGRLMMVMSRFGNYFERRKPT